MQKIIKAKKKCIEVVASVKSSIDLLGVELQKRSDKILFIFKTNQIYLFLARHKGIQTQHVAVNPKLLDMAVQ
jgi:hypothetical protein